MPDLGRLGGLKSRRLPRPARAEQEETVKGRADRLLFSTPCSRAVRTRSRVLGFVCPLGQTGKSCCEPVSQFSDW